MIEMHPDESYSSLYLSSFDLLGALDGINSQGLMVGILADNETLEAQLSRPTLSFAVGIEILLAVRMLLDTCATVEEAKEALRRCQSKIRKVSRVLYLCNSGCKLSPFCQGNNSVVLEVLAAVEMAFQIEMIVD